MDKGQISLTSKILSNMPILYRWKDAALWVTMVMFSSNQDQTFFLLMSPGLISVTCTKTINVHFRQLLPSANNVEFRLISSNRLSP